MRGAAPHERRDEPFESMLAPLGRGRPARIAEIHGTVDLERALAALGRASDAAATAVPEPLIGARVVLIEQSGGPILALAEPITEGRLAASLARHGEGPLGDYVELPEVGSLDRLREVARESGIALSAAARGPFGAGVLVLGGPIWGRQVIVVEPRSLPSEAMTDRHPIEIRPATPADAERIAALFTDEGYPAGPSDIVERLGRFDSEHSRVLVADHDGEILGFVAVHALPRFEHSDRIVRVMALVVDAGVRERGIGRLLMAEAERVGRDVGAAFAEVTAGHHRPDARRLYEELGYDGTVAAYLRKRL